MRSNVRIVIFSILGIAFVMALILGLHLGGDAVLHVGLYSQLIGAVIGGLLAVISVNMPIRRGENAEPWLGRERIAWTFVGLGCIAWGIGEGFWRYFLSQGLQPFPSLADAGYSSLPPLVFLGLVLQPSSGSGRGRMLVLLDSLISMGAILAIAWFLLLGTLAQTPNESVLAKFLGLYYPTTDMALLSAVIFLLLRGQGRLYQANARRVSLLVLGIGLCIFATSDFIFNIQNNAGTYIDGTWVDLGWPFGLMTLGVAAYLRRDLPATSTEAIDRRIRRQAERPGFGPAQIIPYVLLGVLFVVLAFNVLSSDSGQRSIRLVLVLATLLVVGLVVVRQLLTQMENERLARRQAIALDRLEAANNRIEEQARQAAERTTLLEEGIHHLKEVQAQLANGNLRARAHISGGELVPLSGSLNLMADRLMRFEQADMRSQRLSYALSELIAALERYRAGTRFVIPQSSMQFPELQRLLMLMGLRQGAAAPTAPSQPLNRPTSSLTPGAPQSAVGSPSQSAGTPPNRFAPPQAPATPFPRIPSTPPHGSGQRLLPGAARNMSAPLSPTREADNDAASRPRWRSGE